jgi:hypothetical protein
MLTLEFLKKSVINIWALGHLNFKNLQLCNMLRMEVDALWKYNSHKNMVCAWE